MAISPHEIIQMHENDKRQVPLGWGYKEIILLVAWFYFWPDLSGRVISSLLRVIPEAGKGTVLLLLLIFLLPLPFYGYFWILYNFERKRIAAVKLWTFGRYLRAKEWMFILWLLPTLLIAESLPSLERVLLSLCGERASVFKWALLVTFRGAMLFVILWSYYRIADCSGVDPDQRPPFLRYLGSNATAPITILLCIYFMLFALNISSKECSGPPGMAPTIEKGDQLLFNTSSFHLHAPLRGDIVHAIVTLRSGERFSVIGRVAGLPGELIRVEGNALYVNGVRLVEPYETSPLRPGLVVTAKVPQGHYMLLRDNRQVYESSEEVTERMPSQLDVNGRCFFCYYPLSRFGPIFPGRYNAVGTSVIKEIRE